MLKAGVAKVYATAADTKTLHGVRRTRGSYRCSMDITSDAWVNAAASAAEGCRCACQQRRDDAPSASIYSSSREAFEEDHADQLLRHTSGSPAFTPQFVSPQVRHDREREQRLVGLSAVPLMAGYSASKAARAFHHPDPARHPGKGQHHRSSASIRGRSKPNWQSRCPSRTGQRRHTPRSIS